ncbi:uncharacterized protein LOC115632747 [Scaptodrosophila lebanonensis]|uniref:Uncharacterized protein LOC115632747 n=1 Tax=Drosophila lebanonensis TaxID=7225 RepID=A0A6J2UCP4_DROLE|nr:uncharacterized protein LOC115632747 [Scaptodrosophila lebanonensis]
MNIAVISLLLLCLGSSTCALVPPPPPQGAVVIGGPPVVVPVTPPPPPTLTQDLDEIYRLAQIQSISQLLVRYLINDAQFQGFVRIVNSREAFNLRWIVRSQPEVLAFKQWVNQQLLASGGPLELEEIELIVSLVNPFPYWSATVFGFRGFIDELQLYVPLHTIRAHIQTKLLEGGIFAQFWRRLNDLQPVYERLLASPEGQTLIAELQELNIDIVQLDRIIRETLGWNAVNTTVATVTSTPASVPVVV